MELVAPDVDETAGMRELPALERGRRALIRGAGEQEEYQDGDGCEQCTANPAQDDAVVAPRAA